MNFREFMKERLNELPKIDRNDVRLLWHSGYWDGPLTGLLNYEGYKFWFQVVDEPDDPIVQRRFVIIKLTDEQLHEQEHWHELFRQKVGTHTDYDADGRRSGVVHSQNTWHEFYDAFKNRSELVLSDNEIMGWFEEYWPDPD